MPIDARSPRHPRGRSKKCFVHISRARFRVQVGERLHADGPATGVLLAIASGMFLYVGMFHLLADNLENIKLNRQTSRILFLMAMLLGYAMMALLALWV